MLIEVMVLSSRQPSPLICIIPRLRPGLLSLRSVLSSRQRLSVRSVESVFVSTLRVFFRTRIYRIDTDASLILVLSDDVSFVHYGLKAQQLIKR